MGAKPTLNTGKPPSDGSSLCRAVTKRAPLPMSLAEVVDRMDGKVVVESEPSQSHRFCIERRRTKTANLSPTGSPPAAQNE